MYRKNHFHCHFVNAIINFVLKHHRKKLQGRRLDFDCKRRRQARGGKIVCITGPDIKIAFNISFFLDDEIKSAEEKFAESLQLAQIGMYHLLENDVSYMHCFM